MEIELVSGRYEDDTQSDMFISVIHGDNEIFRALYDEDRFNKIKSIIEGPKEDYALFANDPDKLVVVFISILFTLYRKLP